MLNVSELEEMAEKVNRHLDALWYDSGFSGEPPKVTSGVVRIIIEEYDIHLRREGLKAIAEKLHIHELRD